MMTKKVMVTGAGGYIGTQLVRDLVKLGHEVTAVDRFFFGVGTLNEFINNKNVKIVKKDIRDLDINDLKGHDAVCDLACLSNDPAGEIDPQLTFDINRDGRIHVANTAKMAGVEKYIISSSCSVYGQGQEPQLNEESQTNPISVYAKSTLEAEQHNLGLSDSNYSVTALRNATVFGLSTRMRFDLVVNLMTLTAFQKGKIIVMGGGLQWRPLVHLSDVAQAFITVIESESKRVSQEVFNVGLDNFQIKNLAYLVREELPIPVEIDLAPDDADKRDYNVLFNKAKQKLGFEAQVNVSQGIKEIYAALKAGKVDVGPKTVTVQWYRNILDSKKLLDQIVLNERVI
jgi:nucleoside-diphosphate-sugar epimerase